MLLNNTYIGLHLEGESGKIVRSCLESYTELENVHPVKIPHLTLDYFGSIHSDTLKNLALGTRVMLLIANRARNAAPITLWIPEHLVSNTTGEDIIYLPAEIENWLFDHLQYQWYSIQTPHVTLLKWKNLTENQIMKTLEALEKIIPPWSLSMNMKEIFCHGKTERWDRVVKWYACV
ncbi:MAG: hypothetical protein ACD_71C00233G0006 [uncultured bacterium (gcode 4)]|uniref:2'-5' RNA ligase n=1 Tax=uncultured bacterium (gcode 4) TaxID=1234023 RepID=K2A2C7_9BACT|nr:MAG: hypothetical protein ACD_71C00233G0006 [uncultured bacterium (gcode 4)]